MKGDRLLLILNPAAGGGASTSAILEAVRQLRRAGHVVAIHSTGQAGEARRIAAELGSRFDRVAACGGDGTISEVVAGLVDGGVRRPLVVIPAGTANDFANVIGAGGLPEEALLGAFTGALAPLDVGFAGDIPFVNAVSGGAAAELSGTASQEWKATLGPLAYLAKGLAHLPSLRSFDGRVQGGEGIYEGPIFFLAIANGQQVGGGTRIAPDARVDDGLLDAVVLPALPVPSMLGALRALRSGDHHPDLVRMRGERFSFQAEREVAFTVDGEALEASELEFRVVPGAVSLVVHGPAPALLFGRDEKFVDTHGGF